MDEFEKRSRRPFIATNAGMNIAFAAWLYWWAKEGPIAAVLLPTICGLFVHWHFLGGENGQADAISRLVSRLFRALSKVGEVFLGSPPPPGLSISPPEHANGGVKVVWVQDMPTRLRGPYFKYGTLVLAGIAGATFGANFGEAWAVFYALIAAAVVWHSFRSSMKYESYRNWYDGPVTTKVKAAAFVLERDDPSSKFQWNFTAPDGTLHAGAIPWESFDIFEISTYDRVFMPAHDPDKLRRYPVIIVYTPKDGPQMVAGHAGSQADLARLHAVLTREFIEKRPNLPKPPKATSGTGNASKARSRPDLPTNL
jgi:hypothetical protein